MAKNDTSNMGQGMVFEIEQQRDPYGPLYGSSYNDDTFMVISAVQSNNRETVIVAPVNDYDANNDLGVHFQIRRGGATVTKTVCIDRMFKVMKKRLKRFRYVVSSEIVAKVNETIQKMFFGEPLYTKEQALGIAYKEEMMLRAGMMQQHATTREIVDDNMDDHYDPEDYKEKSAAEEQTEFARKMMMVLDAEQENEQETSYTFGDEPKEKKAIAKPKARVILVNEKKPKKMGSKRSWQEIYDNWEDFLTDYATLKSEEMMDKYNLPNKQTLYTVGKSCKKIARENGIDSKIFRKKVTI